MRPSRISKGVTKAACRPSKPIRRGERDGGASHNVRSIPGNRKVEMKWRKRRERFEGGNRRVIGILLLQNSSGVESIAALKGRFGPSYQTHAMILQLEGKAPG